MSETRPLWQVLRDTVTPPPFHHNEHAWSVMARLIERNVLARHRIEATREGDSGLVEPLAKIDLVLRYHESGGHEGDGSNIAIVEAREAHDRIIEALTPCISQDAEDGAREKRIVALGRIADAYERDDSDHAFDKALDAAYDAGRRSLTATGERS